MNYIISQLDPGNSRPLVYKDGPVWADEVCDRLFRAHMYHIVQLLVHIVHSSMETHRLEGRQIESHAPCCYDCHYFYHLVNICDVNIFILCNHYIQHLDSKARFWQLLKVKIGIVKFVIWHPTKPLERSIDDAILTVKNHTKKFWPNSMITQKN